KDPLICAFSEPPIGIEPMTYALREARHPAPGTLPAQIARHSRPGTLWVHAALRSSGPRLGPRPRHTSRNRVSHSGDLEGQPLGEGPPSGGAVPSSWRAVMKPGAPTASCVLHRCRKAVVFLDGLPRFSKDPKCLGVCSDLGCLS